MFGHWGAILIELKGKGLEARHFCLGITLPILKCLTLWGPRNEIKEKTLHFIRKTDLNTIQIIIFITK